MDHPQAGPSSLADDQLQPEDFYRLEQPQQRARSFERQETRTSSDPVDDLAHPDSRPATDHGWRFWFGASHDILGQRIRFQSRQIGRAIAKLLRIFVGRLFGYFWLSWEEAHGASMLIVDLVLILTAVALAADSRHVGFHEYYTVQLVNEVGLPLYHQVPLFIATWSFGYIGPRVFTYAAHVAVACFRAAACLLGLAWVAFRADLGYLRHDAIAAVSLLALASSAHLLGACIRGARFMRDRALAVRNPSDRLVLPGKGFKILYLSPEEQEEQKHAARTRVGKHALYSAAGGSYWHHPTPQLDVLHDSYIEHCKPSLWKKMLSSRTPLQQHFERIADMPLQPLDDLTATDITLHDELFARCQCCLDVDSVPKRANIGREYLLRHRVRRARILRLLPGFQHKGDEVTADVSRPGLHQLCERCESMFCASELLALISGSWMQQCWQYVKVTLRPGPPLLDEMFPLWETAIALRGSARNGCHLCSMIWNSLSPPQQTVLSNEVGTDPLTEDESTRRNLAVFVKVLSPHAQPLSRETGDVSENLQLVVHFGLRRVARFWMEEKFVLRAHSLGRDPFLEQPETVEPIVICLTDTDDLTAFNSQFSASTGSKAALSFVTSWLQMHDHTPDRDDNTILPPTFSAQTITGDAGVNFRPKRLLEIRTSGLLRLVDDNSMRHSVPYTALSYCWNNTNNCALTARSIGRYMHGVAVDTLPLTLQDAVRTTQALGFSYIWIDALCIIQDSASDKAVQLQSMHHIYACAHFVIAAAAAMDSSHSFLVDQTPLAMSSCLIDISGDSGPSRGQLPSTTNAIVALPHSKYRVDGNDDVVLSRLQSRGWVFQEEQLAQRVVYFCDQRLVLRCNHCHRTTVQQVCRQEPYRKVPDTVWGFGPIPIGPAIVAAVKSWMPERRANTRIPFGSEHRHAAAREGLVSELIGSGLESERETFSSMQREQWWKVVERYSERYLSLPTDKLPALQGLANRFQSRILALQDVDDHEEPVRYAFGLWCGPYLSTGLLWYVKDGASQRPALRAPTWSWAAVDGIIGNDSLDGDARPDVCGLTFPRMPDRDARELVVSGRLKPATWHRRPNDRKMYYLGHRRSDKPKIRFYHELGQFEPLTPDLTQGPEVQRLRNLAGSEVGHLVWDSLDNLPPEGSEVHCLRTVVKPATDRDQADFNVPWATRGLALLRVGAESDVFRRVGYFELMHTHGGISYPDSITPGRQGPMRHPPPDIDVARFFDGCEPTTITLI